MLASLRDAPARLKRYEARELYLQDGERRQLLELLLARHGADCPGGPQRRLALEQLQLWSMQVTLQQAADLAAGMPSLRQLWLYVQDGLASWRPQQVLRSFAALPQLRELQLCYSVDMGSWRSLLPLDLSPLAACNKLERLGLYPGGDGAFQLLGLAQGLGALTRLRHLQIWGLEDAWDKAAEEERLQMMLSASEGASSDDGLQQLEGAYAEDLAMALALQRLREQAASMASGGVAGQQQWVAAVAGLQQLEELEAEGLECGSGLWRALAALPQLRVVKLRSLALDGAAPPSPLQRLACSGLLLEGAAAQLPRGCLAAALPQLQSLAINQWGQDGLALGSVLRALEGHQSIRELEIYGRDSSRAAVQAGEQQAPLALRGGFPSLRTVALQLQDAADAQAALACLGSCPALQAADLSVEGRQARQALQVGLPALEPGPAAEGQQAQRRLSVAVVGEKATAEEAARLVASLAAATDVHLTLDTLPLGLPAWAAGGDGGDGEGAGGPGAADDEGSGGAGGAAAEGAAAAGGGEEQGAWSAESEESGVSHPDKQRVARWLQGALRAHGLQVEDGWEHSLGCESGLWVAKLGLKGSTRRVHALVVW